MVVIATFVWMATGYVQSRHQQHEDRAKIKTLTAQALEDESYNQALTDEQKRQTTASLERQAATDKQVKVILYASIMFLLCGKWAIAARGRRMPGRDKVITFRTGVVPKKNRERVDTSGAESAYRCRTPEEIDLYVVDSVVDRCGKNESAMIPILQALQEEYRYLPESALERVCELTEITPAQITGVASFYTQFRKQPVGEHLIKVCHGTACHVAGAQAITDELRRELGIAPGEHTDADGRFTVEEVACMGCCTLAPVASVDETTFGHLTPDTVSDMLAKSSEAGGDTPQSDVPTFSESENDQFAGEVRIGLGSCCVAGGSGKVKDAIVQTLAASGAKVSIKPVGCVGMCHQTPLVEVLVPGKEPQFYAGVDPHDARAIVRRHFPAANMGERFSRAVSCFYDGVIRSKTNELVVGRDIDLRDGQVSAFLGRQKHIATEHCGEINPTDLDEYLRYDGFEALKRCTEQLSPDHIIQAVTESGLRGRGGGGFSTGRKWSLAGAAQGDKKYIVCNGDEGDPGAFMDRMLMESFPYRIVEGIAIAALAVGAEEGFLYIRAEYPLAVERIQDALDECERRGYLGENILGSGKKLELRIMEGAGAFICGEETALLESIEGKRGLPRLRPPYPVDKGLWGKPTLINNVETYANVPWIIRNGAGAFAALGTENSKGTKVFSLAGKINRGGLIEVPMGITIREIVEEIGGGMKDGRRFKALQIGGPSGGCIPEEHADTPVDFEALTSVGAIMGSGGLVVLDDTDCMVDIARYFLAFTQDQSCGKCTFCRVGTRRMLDILERLCEGKGVEGDLEELEDVARSVMAGSLCGLGRTAPNPVLSTLRYFRHEYEAHLQGRCPAGKCKALISYKINDNCVGCTLCAQHCAAEAIQFTPYEKHEIDNQKCVRCDTCRVKCPEDAIEVV